MAAGLGRRLRRRVAILGGVLAVMALGVVGAAWRLHRPYAGFTEPVLVEIARGAGSREMARQLAQAGVVRTEWDFLGARMLHPRVRLQAGEYRFAEPASVVEVLRRLERGDVFYYELLIPEGLNLFEIAAAVDRTGVIAAHDFLAAARKPELVADLAPTAPTLEGFLFPDTYRFPRRTTAEELCQQMHQRFRQVWSELGGAAPQSYTVMELVTIASLVEKETSLAEERGLVASVIYNRLARGMPLEIDPTVVYAAQLAGRYRGAIYRSDLDFDHPYNTYKRKGLPPGPIACPGRESLRAALQPKETDYLFFVAKPDASGGHVFSTTLAAHEKAVAEYRRGVAAGNHQTAAGNHQTKNR